jgi:hypothetical protein
MLALKHSILSSFHNHNDLQLFIKKPQLLLKVVYFFVLQQCKEGQDIHPEEIKAVLLDSAGFNGMA